MNRITWITLGSAFALGALGTLGACTSTREPTPEEYDDTAQAIGSTVATGGGGGDVASMADSVRIALGAMPGGFSLEADGDIHGSRLGLDYRYAIACENLAGAALARCDATTNDATVEVEWSGNLDTPNLDAAVARSGTWSVTGLQTETATFSGDSAFSFDLTLTSLFRPGVTATYEFEASASYDAIKVDTADRKVIEGSATFDVTATHMVTGTRKDVDGRFEIHAELTFDAGGEATLVLDGERSYSINAETGAVARVN